MGVTGVDVELFPYVVAIPFGAKSPCFLDFNAIDPFVETVDNRRASGSIAARPLMVEDVAIFGGIHCHLGRKDDLVGTWAVEIGLIGVDCDGLDIQSSGAGRCRAQHQQDSY
jgi:hypothetical protein